jgi:hypothetical protein
MNGSRYRSLIIVVALVTAAALGHVASAAALTLPHHEAPYPTWCIADSSSGIFGISQGQAIINSGYPIADAMPGVSSSTIYIDSSGRTGTSTGDEEIDFRIWASWWNGTSWQYRAGNWMRKWNNDLTWQVQGTDGRWYTPTAGINFIPQPGDGDIAESRIIVDAARTYWVGYEYYWSRFSGSTFPGATDFLWYTKVTC